MLERDLRAGAEGALPEWMTPAEVSDRLKIPVETLYAWRYKGVGPKATKIGKHLRYRGSSVIAWEREAELAEASE